MWKDKKEVAFLHNHLVDSTKDTTIINRHSKQERKSIEVKAPKVQPDYIDNYNGVDMNDHSIANWTTTIKSTRHYLCIIFWVIDAIINCIYIVVKFFAKEGIKQDWQKYTRKDGRKIFQFDLAYALMETAIRMDWKHYTDPQGKPWWMRKRDHILCECSDCFFCKGSHAWHPASYQDTAYKVYLYRSLQWRKRESEGHSSVLPILLQKRKRPTSWDGSG